MSIRKSAAGVRGTPVADCCLLEGSGTTHLFEQVQDGLRGGVGLGQDAGPCLDEYLVTRKVAGFAGEGKVEIQREGETGGVECEGEAVAGGLRAVDAGNGVLADGAVLGGPASRGGLEVRGISENLDRDEFLGAVTQAVEGDARR